MLKRYKAVFGAMGVCAKACEDGGFVLYEDAAALERRIAELEQRLMAEAEKRAAFEKECG